MPDPTPTAATGPCWYCNGTGHYMHITDGQHETCGCKWEGNDDPR